MANVMQITTTLSNFQHHQGLLLGNGNICETKLTERGCFYFFIFFLENRFVSLALEGSKNKEKKSVKQKLSKTKKASNL